jgi:hypothetical protein
LSAVGSGARPQSSEATANSTIPKANTRRRPRRSASEPAVSTTAASVSAYASTTHCRSVNEDSRSRWISGSAVFTTVMSSRSMTVVTLTAVRVHHLRAIWTFLASGPIIVRAPYQIVRLPDKET